MGAWAQRRQSFLRSKLCAKTKQTFRNAVATAIHQELLKLSEELVGEQKQDLHRERFPLTPEGNFDQIWEAVLVRDDLEQSWQD